MGDVAEDAGGHVALEADIRIDRHGFAGHAGGVGRGGDEGSVPASLEIDCRKDRLGFLGGSGKRALLHEVEQIRGAHLEGLAGFLEVDVRVFLGVGADEFDGGAAVIDFREGAVDDLEMDFASLHAADGFRDVMGGNEDLTHGSAADDFLFPDHVGDDGIDGHFAVATREFETFFVEVEFDVGKGGHRGFDRGGTSGDREGFQKRFFLDGETHERAS